MKQFTIVEVFDGLRELERDTFINIWPKVFTDYQETKWMKHMINLYNLQRELG